jgi:hypothetical protein
MQVGQKMSELKFKLVDAETGAELELPALRNVWDGTQHLITDWKPSRFIDNPGRVFNRIGQPFTPGTFGLKIIEVAA